MPIYVDRYIIQNEVNPMHKSLICSENYETLDTVLLKY